jgi:hypothetical protein
MINNFIIYIYIIKLDILNQNSLLEMMLLKNYQKNTIIVFSTSNKPRENHTLKNLETN